MRKLSTGFLFNFIINIFLTFSTFEIFSIFYFNWIEFIPVCFAYLWDAMKCSSFGVCDRFHIWPLATVLFCFSLYAGIFMWRDTCYWLKIAVLWFFYYYFCAKLYKINCLFFFDNNTFRMVAKCQNNVIIIIVIIVTFHKKYDLIILTCCHYFSYFFHVDFSTKFVHFELPEHFFNVTEMGFHKCATVCPWYAEIHPHAGLHWQCLIFTWESGSDRKNADGADTQLSCFYMRATQQLRHLSDSSASFYHIKTGPKSMHRNLEMNRYWSVPVSQFIPP